MLINNEWVKNEIKEEIKKFLETNENELRTTRNVWDIAKAALRGKFIDIQAYLKKIETFTTNNLTLRLQELEEQQQRAQIKQKEGNNQDKGRVKYNRD